jgi:hypothetical protein
MSDEKEKTLIEALDELSEIYQETFERYEKECNEWWSNLSYDDRLMAFYSVCKRIHNGDVKERRSYRGVIYDVFEFGPDAYGTGMDCGYMDIHNFIYSGIESEKEKENGSSTETSSS